GGCEGQFAPNTVDYDRVIPFKHRLFEIAWKNFESGERKDLRPEYEQFCNVQAHWLEEYALFRALKDEYNGASYLEWPLDLVQRAPAALTEARRKVANKIDQFRFEQFLLFLQGAVHKKSVFAKSVCLICDISFFACPETRAVCGRIQHCLLDER